MPQPSIHPSDLEGPTGLPVAYLLDAASEYEASILRRWLRDQTGDREPRTIRISSSRRGHGGELTALEDLLDAEEDHYLVPIRLVWMAPQRRGRRQVSWLDVVPLGDPRDPRGLRARWIRWLRPSRMRVVTGGGEAVSVMAEDYRRSGQVDALSAYVTRRAWLTLDKGERRLRGNRYKIPRFVPEAILSRGEFLETVASIAAETGLDREKAEARAEHYLREIAATHSPYVIDLIANLIQKLYSQGYGQIRYSREEIDRLTSLEAGHTVVFLPSHRSNLDRLSLQYLLWENDLPPNHTAGGINLNFFPVGPLVRRTGVFFIRRSFKDNPLYKAVLRAYLDYLVEKRFPLEWYLEGGRSRSGKLLPPRFGLLGYVVDSWRRGKTDEILLVPVSIAYDQIQDVPGYAREAQGKDKEKESIGWLLRAIRSLRRRYGDIHVRFADPVPVSSLMGEPGEDEEVSVGLQKLAFEVMYRIGRVTPVTPTSLVCIALLAGQGVARGPEELAADCSRLTRFVRSRGIPTTEPLDPAETGWVSTVLDWLVENQEVSRHEALGRRVYWLEEEQMMRVSYYRNMVVHFFVNRALAEMALGAAAESGEDRPETVRTALLDLRDLLKFEFFFPDKDEFLAAVGADLEVDVPGWERLLAESGAAAVGDELGPPVAYWSVLPFLDAYQVVGDELEALRGRFEEKRFLKACLARARMYRIEERLISAESASQVLFKSALALARNRDLAGDGPGVEEARARFAAEVRAARRLAAVGL